MNPNRAAQGLGWTVALVYAFFALGAGAARAHPHIFIKQRVAALFDKNGLSGIRLTWRFDPLYSSMMVSAAILGFAVLLMIGALAQV